jgi:hypothetical protein
MECLDWLSHNGGKPPRGSRRGRMIYGISRKGDGFNSKSPRRPLCTKGGGMTSNRCFEDVPAGPKRTLLDDTYTKGEHTAREGGRQTRRFLGATHSRAVTQVATHSDASGRRPPPSSIAQGECFWFGYFFFQNTQGGEGEGGFLVG